MKAQKSRLRNACVLTALFATSVAALVNPVTGQAKENVELQFWDMIWGSVESLIAG